jgi:hypothetical protein
VYYSRSELRAQHFDRDIARAFAIERAVFDGRRPATDFFLQIVARAKQSAYTIEVGD